MTTQSADVGELFDAVSELRRVRQGMKGVLLAQEDRTHVQFNRFAVGGAIDTLSYIIADMEAVYAEHAELLKFVKMLNKVVRHYEIED